MIITDDMIATAQQLADQADERRAQAEAEAATHPDPTALAERIGILTNEARTASIRVKQLEHQAEQHRAALDARAEREQAADEYLTAAVRELTESRQAVLADLAKAEQAYLDAVHRVQAYDALVDRHRLEHDVRDLGPVEGVELDTTSLGKHGVKIRGVQWSRVAADAVVAFVAGRIARAVLGRRHTLSTWLTYAPGVAVLEQSGVLTGLPDLEVDKQPAIASPHITSYSEYRQSPKDGRPYLEQAERSRLERGPLAR